MQKNYNSYSAAQFLEDPFFIEWIKHRTPEAVQFWTAWVRSAPSNLNAMKEAEAELRAILSVRPITATETETEQVWERIQASLQNSAGTVYQIKKSGRIKTRLLRNMWWAAAAVLILVMGMWWLILNQNQTKKSTLAVTVKQHDILPGGNRAVLTLSDGTKVILDTANNGAITRQGSVTVIKLNNGQLAYDKEGVASTEVFYNTISTPKGGQYQLVLADGSKVWLNAASSLRFPTVFPGKERIVELTGEGYFEVAHDAEKPFHVSVNGMDVKVLGTHFNINSYSDEPAVKTTLLEGRVMVKNNENLVYLNPGQQAILQPGQDNIRIANDVDVEEVVAWKNGLFIFNNAPLEDIMRQIERWYNVDVTYQGEIPQDRFNGNISRNTNLSEVLKVLEYSNIRFRVEGNTITVLPQK